MGRGSTASRGVSICLSRVGSQEKRTLQPRIICEEPNQLSASFAGREFDARLLAELPDGLNPCGENGEFHTFAGAGLMFTHDIPVTVGETIERDGFVFTDVLIDDTLTSPPSLGPRQETGPVIAMTA